MGKEETLAGLLMELRRGTIVLCVLSQLKQPRYGYDLVKILGRHHMPVEANTLYPLCAGWKGRAFCRAAGKPEAQSRESIIAGRRWAMRCSPP